MSGIALVAWLLAAAAATTMVLGRRAGAPGIADLFGELWIAAVIAFQLAADVVQVGPIIVLAGAAHRWRLQTAGLPAIAPWEAVAVSLIPVLGIPIIVAVTRSIWDWAVPVDAVTERRRT